jgi:F-type H+-transporting ATPase subunit b
MLNFDPVTIIITAINIFVLFFILRVILFKPVTKFINERSARIAAEIANAAKDREEAKRLLNSHAGKLKDAAAEADDILRTARQSGEKRAEEIIDEARAQAASLLDAARKQIDAERQAAYLAFRADASRLVLAAAGKLLKRELSAEDARRFADEAVAAASQPAPYKAAGKGA